MTWTSDGRTPVSGRRRRLAAVLAAAAVCGGLAPGGCAARAEPGQARWVAAAPSAPASASVGAPSAPASGAADAPPMSAPASPFAVGVRQLELSRGADRPLPTTVWYPAAGTAGAAPRTGVPVAAGRFPLVVFSHGLTGAPQYYAPLTARWTAAGFVVAAPAYPHTKHGVALDVLDVANQPADASYVLTRVLALAGTADDPLAGHLDPARVGAAGHSAGGFTTVGMLTGQRDARLRAAVVIAGGALGGAFTGAPASLLFVHGDRDPTVSYATGRAAYDSALWPKALLTLVGQGHVEYLVPGARGFDRTLATTTDFLRFALYGDAAARGRMLRDGSVPGLCRLDARL